jgi:hypothetical protein
VQGADLRFFLGRGPNPPKGDEVILDCDDSYAGIPEKVREIFRWAYKQEYDFVSKIDDDVVMDHSKFLEQCFNSDFEGPGKTLNGTARVLQMPYGFCYVLSKKAMAIVASSPLPQEDERYEQRHRNNDEYWVSWLLQKEGIYLHVNWLCRMWDGTDLYPELPNTFIFCVHMHSLSKPEEVHEMCRIWRERFQ